MGGLALGQAIVVITEDTKVYLGLVLPLLTRRPK